MSAVVQTGSSEARSACGTKVIVFVDWAPTTRGAASAAAPTSVDFRKVRRFIAFSLDRFLLFCRRHRAASGAPLGPVHPAFLRWTLLWFWELDGALRARGDTVGFLLDHCRQAILVQHTAA